MQNENENFIFFYLCLSGSLMKHVCMLQYMYMCVHLYTAQVIKQAILYMKNTTIEWYKSLLISLT